MQMVRSWKVTVTAMILAFGLAALSAATAVPSDAVGAEPRGSDVALPFNVNADCVEIAAWVAEYRADLPRTLVGIANYPVAYRRAIFRSLAREEQARLWREHLEHALTGITEMTDEQETFVREVIAGLPMYLSASAGDPLITELGERIRSAFGRGLAAELFGTLGPLEARRTVGTADAPLSVDCSCSAQSDWCSSGADCVRDMMGCTVVGGCGFLWLYDCDGLCWREPE